DFAAATRRARFPTLPPKHADRTAALEYDALRQTFGLEPEIAAMKHRLEKGGGRRPALAALLIDMKCAAAPVIAGVEIGNRFEAGLFGGGAECVKQVPMHARGFDPQFAAGAVQCALTEKVVFVFLEKRQHVVPAPPGKPKLAPMIVVRGLAAHIDHRVDRRRAADRLAARIVQASAVEPLFGFGLEAPIRTRIADSE